MTADARLARRIALAVHGARTVDDLAGEIQSTLLALGCGGGFSALFVTPDQASFGVFRTTAPGLAAGAFFPVPGDATGIALRDGTPFRAEGAPARAAWGEAAVPIAACLPLVYRDERYGVLVLHDPVPADAMPALEVLAEQAALAFVRVQLLDETVREHALDAAKLAAIGQAGDLLRNLELDVIVTKAVELSLSVVSAEVGSLLLLEEDRGLVPKVEWGLPEATLSRVRFADGTRVVDRVVETREAVLAHEPARDPRFALHGLDAHLANLLVIPLATQARTLGCLVIVNSAGASFTARDQDVLTTIAGLAGIAVENALLHRAALEKERYREQLRLAGEIQKKLLPAGAPEVPGLLLHGWSAPCDDTGGDYYDFFPLDGGRVAFCVGDVSGHGIGAALLMTTARAFLRAYVGLIPDLGQLFARLNDLLAPDMGGDRFITLLFGVLDPRAGTFVYTSAGHDPPLLHRRAADSFELLDSTGLPLGMVEGMEFPPVTVTGLAAGDLLLALTDGVVEAMNPAHEEFGRERVLEIVRTHPDAAPAELIATIQAAAREFCAGAAPRDDWTMVAIRAT